MIKVALKVLTVLFIVVFIGFLVLGGSEVQTSNGSYQPNSLQPSSIPPSLTLLAAGARWAAQNGNSTLYIDWEDNYLAHGNTDGIDWGPWPSEASMENQTDSVYYMLTQAGLNVTLAGDFPSDLSGYNLLVIEAYWAVTPANLAAVRDFIANGGGVVLLAGVPEFFRTYCKDWWTYCHATDNASLDEDDVFGCDGNYFNTGGYANVTVDNPFNTSLMSGDTLFESAGYSNAGVLDPVNASIVAQWNPGLYGLCINGLGNFSEQVAFAYTHEYGSGRVYYQATYTPLDPPTRIPGDINGDGKVDLTDLAILAQAYGSTPGSPRWNPNADILGDGKVDLADLTMLALHWLQHSP